MKIFNLSLKIIGQFIFVIIFFSPLHAKNMDKFNNTDSLARYFSGSLLLSDNQYNESYKFFRKLDGLELNHNNFSKKFIYSLINSGNFNEAFNYSKRLNKKKLDTFESNLVIGIFHLKNSDYSLAQKYFLKAKKKNAGFVLDNYVSNSLYNLSNLEKTNLPSAALEIEKLDERFENLKKIQNVLLNCFFKSPNTIILFDELLLNKNNDFSRYNYFYAAYLASSEKTNEAKKIINEALKYYPRNLLLNQYKIDLKNRQNKTYFDCSQQAHIIAEILYITANVLSSQSIYSLSNFYLNLAKYLNNNFFSYNTLLAENFYKVENLKNAKKIYENLSNKGEAYKWYSTKQLARILIKEKNKDKAIQLISEAYENLENKEIYETFDYAEFLKNNEKFKDSIQYYTNVINSVKKDHPLYPDSTDGRGVAYERIGKWQEAENDLLDSLKVKPNQAYVLNYLAYSWIEKGINIEKSLNMLRKADKLKSNDPFIIDSLGWALFKLERYKDSKDYLQLAVRLMPGDPIVNDHYGDSLWKNGNEIQARYYWKYVLNLESAEDNLKKIIKTKLINGL